MWRVVKTATTPSNGAPEGKALRVDVVLFSDNFDDYFLLAPPIKLGVVYRLINSEIGPAPGDWNNYVMARQVGANMSKGVPLIVCHIVGVSATLGRELGKDRAEIARQSPIGVADVDGRASVVRKHKRYAVLDAALTHCVGDAPGDVYDLLALARAKSDFSAICWHML